MLEIGRINAGFQKWMQFLRIYIFDQSWLLFSTRKVFQPAIVVLNFRNLCWALPRPFALVPRIGARLSLLATLRPCHYGLRHTAQSLTQSQSDLRSMIMVFYLIFLPSESG